MDNGKAERKKSNKKGVNYEEAINEAFSEIFQNLKEIEKDIQLQRKMVHLERRRGSAPAEMPRLQATAGLEQNRVNFERRRTRSECATTSSKTTTVFKQLPKMDLERRRAGSNPVTLTRETTRALRLEMAREDFERRRGSCPSTTLAAIKQPKE